MGQRHSEADEAMREYGLREPEFRDMEIGFRINLYRNTEDALEDTTQGAEKLPKLPKALPKLLKAPSKLD